MSTLSPYLYMASKPNGSSALGVRSARNEAQLAELLRRERMVLMRTWRLPAWAVRQSGFRLKDQAELHAQLGALLSRGVPLVEALDVTARSVSNSARGRVMKMRDQVASGSSLADACRASGAFDRVTISVYKAAERTGDLAGAAKQMAVTAKRQLAMSAKAITLAIYPCIVISISVLVTLVMLMIVVPMIGEALVKQGLKLPGYTTTMVSIGLFMRENVVLLTLVGAGLGAAAFVSRRRWFPAVARVFKSLPLINPLVLAQEIARFFTVMAAMSRSGVPLADALAVATQVVSHAKLRSQLETLRRRLVEGGALRQLIDGVDALPLPTRRLLIAAERSGDLDSAFEALATDSAEEVDRRSMRLLAALEPLLLLGMFLIIGGLLFSVMWPMIRLAASQQM